MRLGIVALAFLLGFATSSYAEDSKISVNAGLTLGLGLISGATSLTYGGLAGVRYGQDLGLSLHYSKISLGVPASLLSGYEAKSSLSSWTLDFNYFFTSFLHGLSLGTKMGLAFDSNSIMGNGVSDSTTNTYFIYGFSIGYDAPLTDRLSLGPEIALDVVPAISIVRGTLVGLLRYRF